MKDMDNSGIPGKEEQGGGRLCPECGSRVENTFRFCPGCGSFVPEYASVRRVPDIRREESEFEDDDNDEEEGVVSLALGGGGNERGGEGSFVREQSRSNADRAGTSFREFNAAIQARRGRRDRKGGIFLFLLFFMFVAALGGGVYWFLQQAERIPWENDVRPKQQAEPTPPAQEKRDPDLPPLATPGGAPSDGTPALPSIPSSPAVQADVLEISRPTKGVVIGSGVNLRGSHTVSSPVVGKVTTGNEVEVLESWTSDEGAEVVALVDVELAGDDGKTVRLVRGRGLSVISGPDSRGMLRVALPDDRSKKPYTVAASSMSNPHSWPWYKIRPKGAKEGWIFGKFITVFNPRENTLSPTVLDRALHTFGATKDALEGALGKPLKTASKKVTRSGVAADEHTLTFDGLTAVLLERGGASEVRSLTLTSSKHSLDGGFAVGSDRRAVLSILGLPNSLDKGSEVYRLDANSGIRIRYENYTVKTLHVGALN